MICLTTEDIAGTNSTSPKSHWTAGELSISRREMATLTNHPASPAGQLFREHCLPVRPAQNLQLPWTILIS